MGNRGFLSRVAMVLPLVCLAASGQAQWREARETIREWVRSEKLISEERTKWQTKKELLRQSIDLLEKESQALSEQIKRAKSRVADKRREQERLAKALKKEEAFTELLRSRLVEWETRIQELATVFPPPLMERLEVAMARLPENPGTKVPSVQERVRNLIGIVKEINQFHSGITVTDEVREDANGERVRVRVLYVGLAQAYFADETGRLAGWGRPEADGWEWERRSEIGPIVKDAINIYEKQKAPRFIGLPAAIE